MSSSGGPLPARIGRRDTATARLALGTGTIGGAAGGVLVAVWAAARDAVTPGHPVPRLGPDLALTVMRAITQTTLDPIIGATGSRPIFCVALTVFLTLFALITVLATRLPLGWRTGAAPAPPPRVADPVIVPLAWHRPIRETTNRLYPASSPLTTYLPEGQQPPIPNDRISSRQAGATGRQPTTSTSHGSGLDTNAAGVWVRIGVAGQQPMMLELCAQHGLGLTGPGADGAARHLLASLLTRTAAATGAAHHEAEPALVVIPAPEAHRLLGTTETHPPRHPNTHADLNADTGFDSGSRPSDQSGDERTAGSTDWADQAGVASRLYQAPTLGIALTYLEQQLLTRARTHQAHPATNAHPTAGTPPGTQAPVVLFAQPDPPNRARLEAIVAHGSRHQIAAVFTSPWPTGATLALAVDGTVTTGPPQRADLAALTKAYTTSSHHLQALLHHPSAPTQQPRRHATPTTATEPTTTPPAHPTGTTIGAPTADTEPTREPQPTTGTGSTANTGDPHPSAWLTTAQPNSPPPAPTSSALRRDTTAGRPSQPVSSGANAAGDHARPIPGHLDRARDRVTEPVDPPGSDIASGIPAATADERTAGPDDPVVLAGSDAVLLVGCFAGVRVRIGAGLSGAHRPTEAPAARDITAQLSPQDVRLVACLAVHPDGVAADSVQEILWPGTPDRAAGKRLRTALGHLRAVLRAATGLPGATFAAHLDGRYHLGAHPQDTRIWVDYTVFDAALRAARCQTGPARIDALHQVAALYSGPLLDGIDLDWPELSTLQEAARRCATTALATLAEHYQYHDPDKAIAFLSTLLTHEPGAEKPAELLTTLYLRHGNPRAAQHTYARLATQLSRLGRHPSNTITDVIRGHPRRSPSASESLHQFPVLIPSHWTG